MNCANFQACCFKADGRESIPALFPKPLLPASRDNSKQEKRVTYLWSPNFSAGDSLGLGCPALQWACFLPHRRAKHAALPGSVGWDQGHKFHWSFILPELQQERGDALPLQVNDAAAIIKKNQHCLWLGLNCIFMGKQIPLGELEGQDSRRIKQELRLQTTLCIP